MTDTQVVSAGDDMDITVEVCTGGVIEVGLTDGAEAMYGVLDIKQAEELIAMLERAVAQARRS
jgi:hypothetical protein